MPISGVVTVVPILKIIHELLFYTKNNFYQYLRLNVGFEKNIITEKTYFHNF